MNEAVTTAKSGSDDGAALVALLLSLTGEVAGGSGPLGYASLKKEIKEAVARDPFDATVATVLGGAFLFYLAEKGKNPKVESYFDALVFISTCLSVGYHDVFARTPGGKAIATAVMTIGPALSGAIFESPPRRPQQGRRRRPRGAAGHRGDARRDPRRAPCVAEGVTISGRA